MLDGLGGGLEDEFGYVLAGWALDAAVAEVLDYIAAVLPDGAEVKCVTAGVKSEDLWTS